jgi:hypothetical protein
VSNLLDPINTAISDIQPLVNLLQSTLGVFSNLNDHGIDEILANVFSGGLRRFSELAATLKAAQHLPKIIGQVRASIPRIQTILDDVLASTPNFVSNLQVLLQVDWVANYKGDITKGQAISDRVHALQVMYAEMIPEAESVWHYTDFLFHNLGTSSSGIGSPQLNTGIATYSKWVSGSFDVACLTSGTVKWTVPGFPKRILLLLLIRR